MFKALRNKFLILNLITISIMMMIAFTSIYLITYNNTHSDINRELHKLAEFNPRSNEPPLGRSDMPPISKSDDVPNMQKRSVSFTILLDSTWDIVKVNSIFDMDDTFYEDAAQSALSKYKSQGQFKLDGNYWAFMIRPHPTGYKIIFLDITFQQNILMKLIYTFLAVAFIMLIVIFFISRFFANRAIAPIKEAFNKQKQFIADASHELKTPLAVINTNTDVLLSSIGTSLGDEVKWLHYIKGEAERMAKLTNDLLYLTQVDYSDIQMVFSDFNLSECAENIILTMEAVIFENNISLEYDIRPDIMISGSMEQITQVIIILLDNAIKYANPKGTINISLKKQHNTALLSVTNTGDGIPNEELDKIFDRFYRIDKSRSRSKGGHGLGLPIAQTILNQHHGKIAVTSILHESTTFYIELPCVNN
ncbi:sensor histidine kinase [Cellulosilyticum sp. I15G10I2]|uniref:sensor histidine kinase n=1 Tax=Cellulosilyticum sp. I15G10I2 TaxID=1892843 RepID=UPI00085BC599|nr:HAMP domain-containing sensor histidine kinase [Cellulosilyticum sp. I15G10I2]